MSTRDSQVLAQAAHDLGSALWFGGAVMGVAGVNKSGNDLSRGIDKMRVAQSAWSRFAPAQAIGIGAVLLAGRQLAPAHAAHRALPHGLRAARGIKGVVVVLGAAATAFATYSGQKIGRLSEQAVRDGRQFDVQDASLPNSRTPDAIAAWQRPHRLLQYTVPAMAAANIVLNAHVVRTARPGAPLTPATAGNMR